VATVQKTSPLAKNFEVVSAAEAIKWINALFYGDPGAGKTYLGGTAEDHPDTSPMLVIDIEGGTLTLRNRPNIDVVSVRSEKEIVKIHNELHASNNGYYKTVMLDSLTELQKLDMRGIMLELVGRRPDLDPDVPSQREWGKSAEHVRRIVRAFRDLPMNTIMTALATEFREESGATRYFPSLPGKLRSEIPGFMDIVGYLYTKQDKDNTVRTLQVTGSRRVVAKDRTSALGGVIENPTIPGMWEMIHQEREND